jgi:hypothetical protein
MAAIGFGRTRNELLDTVQKILERDQRPNPFKNNRPGKDWYYAYPSAVSKRESCDNPSKSGMVVQ